ncbi:unnamed protein product [Paramecium sonneborni]|uniref:Uncharacterized protein n=1 Tax=Paramecium sonneborni TaxID=65129 RepID=A0A8S1L6C9_9CILI|nr:unnamed protein product [Paramecium sonneborni]
MRQIINQKQIVQLVLLKKLYKRINLIFQINNIEFSVKITINQSPTAKNNFGTLYAIKKLKNLKQWSSKIKKYLQRLANSTRSSFQQKFIIGTHKLFLLMSSFERKFIENWNKQLEHIFPSLTASHSNEKAQNLKNQCLKELLIQFAVS